MPARGSEHASPQSCHGGAGPRERSRCARRPWVRRLISFRPLLRTLTTHQPAALPPCMGVMLGRTRGRLRCAGWQPQTPGHPRQGTALRCPSDLEKRHRRGAKAGCQPLLRASPSPVTQQADSVRVSCASTLGLDSLVALLGRAQSLSPIARPSWWPLLTQTLPLRRSPVCALRHRSAWLATSEVGPLIARSLARLARSVSPAASAHRALSEPAARLALSRLSSPGPRGTLPDLRGRYPLDRLARVCRRRCVTGGDSSSLRVAAS
jgi:hypothetical protein